MYKRKVLDNNILEKLITELWNANMYAGDIANKLGIQFSTLKSIASNLPIEKDSSRKVPKGDTNFELVNKILYDADIPIATDAIINVEKQRFEEYRNIEAKCLSIMRKLLNYYDDKLTQGDMEDAERRDAARVANDFIKATHNVRDELLKQYALDNERNKKREERVLDIELLDSPTDSDI